MIKKYNIKYLFFIACLFMTKPVYAMPLVMDKGFKEVLDPEVITFLQLIFNVFKYLAPVLVLVFSEGIRKILIEQILFANRDASSLDDLTSGRITIYSGFGNLIKGHEFVGNGALYFECFYLSAIVQFGIPVGLFLWGYVAYAIYSVKKIYSYFCYGWLMMILVLSYSLNGLFEGLPPFGPGTKNFLLWLVFGIASSQLFYIDKRSINMDQNQS